MAKHMVHHFQREPNKTFKAAQKVAVTQVALGQLSKHNLTAAFSHRRAAAEQTGVRGLGPWT